MRKIVSIIMGFTMQILPLKFCVTQVTSYLLNILKEDNYIISNIFTAKVRGSVFRVETIKELLA